METQFSQHFSYKKLIKFVLPPIVMMVFTSVYGVVDGLFVSNFVGKTAFAAVNLIIPVIMAFAAVGFMIGAGGSALVSKILGEGDRERANRCFSMLVTALIGAGLILTALSEAILRPVAGALGAEGEMLDDCVLYGAINLAGLVPYMLQNAFQTFFPTAEKPKLGLLVIVAAGLTNAALDALFIVGFRWGLVGAAAATVTGQVVGGVLPLVYFTKKNGSLLRFRPTRISVKTLAKACANGSSEMLTNLSISVVNMLYNFQLIRFAGADGVAAYGFIMYVNFVFISIFLGYSIGVAPVVGFNYGAGNRRELKSLFLKSLTVIAAFAVVMVSLALALNAPLSYLFVGYDKDLYELTRRGFFIYSFAFLLIGFNVFSSAFFTALNNGLVSAVLSFLRTLVFQIVGVLVLPLLFGLDGIWFSIIAAESLGIVTDVVFLTANRKKYGYL